MRVSVGGENVSRTWRSALCLGFAGCFLALAAVPVAAHGGTHIATVDADNEDGAPAPQHRRIWTPSAGDPPFSAIVVDENTGREIYGVNENALRHPASITKVMTLYLLFEQLDKGAMTLETPIHVSQHAAAQEPSKLGIAAGDSLSAEDAIKAVVTRSANDVAVAIAEAIGGDESTFAAMMTRKAHALGMSRTLYRNASGLPNDEQWTTAHDLTLLARSLEERYPNYFKYFSTHEFNYDGEIIGNHNHLLGRVDGVDGIKTGYTHASGFNLLTSVHRDGRSLVAVVLGGRTGGIRDRIMENLIEDHIAEASNRGHTAPVVADNESPVAPRNPALAAAVTRSIKPVAVAVAAHARANDSGEGDDNDDDAKPTPAPAAKLAPPPIAKPAPVVPPAPIAKAPEPPRPAPVKLASADPTALGWVKGPDAVIANARGKGKEESKAERQSPAASAGASGWSIQIGAVDEARKATDLLERARAHSKRELAAARPITEKFVKNGDTFYRARFAGLDEDGAAEACKTLKRDGFSCFPVRPE